MRTVTILATYFLSFRVYWMMSSNMSDTWIRIFLRQKNHAYNDLQVRSCMLHYPFDTSILPVLRWIKMNLKEVPVFVDVFPYQVILYNWHPSCKGCLIVILVSEWVSFRINCQSLYLVTKCKNRFSTKCFSHNALHEPIQSSLCSVKGNSSYKRSR